MMTSDIAKALNSELSWDDFCTRFSKERENLLSRSDGILTSADCSLVFDTSSFVVSFSQISSLYTSVKEKKIDLDDLSFIGNAILLSGFDFISDQVEELCHRLTEVDSVQELHCLMNESDWLS